MGNNEEKFRAAFIEKFGPGYLRGKKRFVEAAESDAVEISSDESLEEDGWLILIEIDSFNTTKPAVGQYVLLNELSRYDRSRTLFLIIHCYKGFNPKRTLKNLKFVSTLLPHQPAIRYLAFSREKFYEFCEVHKDVRSLVRGLTALMSGEE